MTKSSWIDLQSVLRLGLISGVISLSLSVIGLVATFAGRDIIGGVLSLGHIFLFGPSFAGGYLIARNSLQDRPAPTLIRGVLLGFICSLPTVLLLILSNVINWRDFLINVSPQLIALLTFDQGQTTGIAIFIGVCSFLGLIGSSLTLLPAKAFRPIAFALTAVFAVGLLSEIITLAWGNRGIGLAIRRVMFAARGLSVFGTILIFGFVASANAWWSGNRQALQDRTEDLPERQKKILSYARLGAGILFLLLLPFILRTYLTEVIDNVAMYVLMGLGLNIVVGFAGLLDLGYVAFFAIGAYTMGALTTQSDLNAIGLTFWGALPIAVGMSVLAGIVLGIPVLRMRGDYLAIVTLGFGEIIRILALSDALAPAIGGAQGILKIPKAMIGNFEFVSPESIYYIFLGGCLIAAFITWRLRDGRLGRQWMAMREDEDVAEAMGINLVKTKLLAFAIGAAFSGLAGAIFASKLSSIFPHSFSLLVSINALSLIILGGMGSIPGVVVGALLLVGLPELLREFAEYRLLFYGAILIVMMIARPEGFIPSSVRRRELREGEEEASLSGSAAIAAGD
jgi:branched-chain amino acid transport system permease protein